LHTEEEARELYQQYEKTGRNPWSGRQMLSYMRKRFGLGGQA